MKRKSLLLLLVSMVAVHISSAQNKKFGIIGGANYSTIVGDFADIFDTERRLAYHLGGFLELPLSDKIVFSPRLVYSSQGYISNFDSQNFRFDLEPQPQKIKSSNRSNYLNIPLLFKFKLADKFGVNIGPQIGFLLNTAVVYKEVEGVNDIEEGDRSSNSGDFKLDYGTKGGFFYNISEKTFVELNYYHGFSNISRGGITDVRNNHSVFQLSLGYYLF